jgi:branched-chain amino acid aminotransferase
MSFDYGLHSGRILRRDQLPDELGDGRRVYEVMRLIDSKILYLEEHLQRLEGSLRFHAPEFSLEAGALYRDLTGLIRRAGEDHCNLRLEAALVDGRLEYTAILLEGRYPDEAMKKEGVALESYEYERKDPLVKVVDRHYKEKVGAFIEARGIYEALLTHDGIVTEGSRSNIFFLKEGKVYSPREEDILSGITRRNLLAFLAGEKIPLVRGDIPLADIGGFEGAFLSGTSIHVLAVRSIDESSYDPDLPLFRRIESGFAKWVADSLKKTPAL